MKFVSKDTGFEFNSSNLIVTYMYDDYTEVWHGPSGTRTKTYTVKPYVRPTWPLYGTM